MRIIAGKYGGRRLAAVPANIRPTGDKLRETLYNVLGPSVRDSVWLDAFAGSGAVVIEALSRGARLVIANDRNSQACKLLRKNLQIFGIEKGCEIYEKDVFVLLKKLKAPPIDFVFLDPPYDFRRYRKLFDQLSLFGSLCEKTMVILQVFKKINPDFLSVRWVVARTLLQGDNQLIFIQPRSGSFDEDSGKTQKPETEAE